MKTLAKKSNATHSERLINKSFILFSILLLLLSLSLYLGLRLGSTQDLQSDVFWQIFWDLRVPRVFTAFSVGAVLSLAGVLLQVLFLNPMSEPYTLGVSSGASLGAIILSACGLNIVIYGFNLGAMIGALIFSIILIVFVRKGLSQSSILLLGVMLGFLGSSLVSMMMVLKDSAGIQAALSWLLGDLSKSQISGALSIQVIALVSLIMLTLKSRQLDALLLGEDHAKALGVPVKQLRLILIIYSCILVASSVSSAGMIGFIGLIVPHLLRQFGVVKHSQLLVASYLLGGSFLVFSDMLSRVLFTPYELPVGVVTALIGAPLYIVLIFKSKKRMFL